MTRQKDTESTAEKQPSNSLYGRIPLELLPELREHSNLECRIFMFLSALGNWKRDPLGEVCFSQVELARIMGIDRKSLWRGLRPLAASGLVALGRTGCVTMPHYLRPHAAPPVASGRTDSPQPQQNTSSYKAPIRSEEVHKKQKAPVARKKPKSVLYWDSDLEQLRALETHPNVNAWYAKWGGLLGSQERLEGEIDKANDWLKAKPKAIARTKNFQMFMERWLGKVE